MMKTIRQWWQRLWPARQPDAVEAALFDHAQTADQALIGLARAFVIDQREREAAARRAARFRRWVWALFLLATLGGYAWVASRALLPGSALGEGSGLATSPSVALVKVEGQISAAAKLASAERVVAALRRAFEDKQVQRVLLYIDSPGGAPVEAERIMNAVAELRKKHDKPIQAVIGNLGASAGYMVALSADEIVCAKYSLVGSIGAILQSWDVHRALERFDVKAKTYASGNLKGMLNPFEPSTPEAEAKAQSLVDELGRQFASLLTERRGSKLTRAPDSYTSGEVWGGQEALQLGLVDANGTLESLMAQHPDLKLVNYGPFDQRPGWLPGWMQTMEQIAQSLQALAQWVPAR